MHILASNSLKSSWNDVLDIFKKYYLWHNLRLSVGRPASGDLRNISCSCKAKHKVAIRDAYYSFEVRLSYDMYKLLLIRTHLSSENHRTPNLERMCE